MGTQNPFLSFRALFTFEFIMSLDIFCNKPISEALYSFPASTVTNKSAGLLLPSFFSLSISSSAFAFITLTFIPVSFCDAPEPWQLYFQEAATPVMEGILYLHNDIMAVITFILVFTLWMLSRTIYLFKAERNSVPSKQVHGTVIELVWTLVPSFILVTIAIPSFSLLYSMDEVIDPAITLKVVGHQWYWSYEYSDYNTSDDEMINFDSYMIAEDDLESQECQNRVPSCYHYFDIFHN